MNCPTGCVGRYATGETGPVAGPLSTLTVLVYSAIYVHLITYHHAGARPHPGISLYTYLLALYTDYQALGVVAGLYHVEYLSPWIFGALLMLLILLLQACGNLMRVLRLH